jgi:hypothetical protein
LSMLRLPAACDRLTSGQQPLGPALRDLAHVDIEALANKRLLMGSRPFEAFVAAWLRVRLLLAAESGSILTLKQLLLAPLPIAVPSTGGRLPAELVDSDLCIPSTIGAARLRQALADVLNGGAGNALKPNVVYTFGDNNPGFDFPRFAGPSLRWHSGWRCAAAGPNGSCLRVALLHAQQPPFRSSEKGG